MLVIIEMILFFARVSWWYGFLSSSSCCIGIDIVIVMMRFGLNWPLWQVTGLYINPVDHLYLSIIVLWSCFEFIIIVDILWVRCAYSPIIVIIQVMIFNIFTFCSVFLRCVHFVVIWWCITINSRIWQSRIGICVSIRTVLLSCWCYCIVVIVTAIWLWCRWYIPSLVAHYPINNIIVLVTCSVVLIIIVTAIIIVGFHVWDIICCLLMMLNIRR